MVESVKIQQRVVIEKLQAEQEQLEQELDKMGLHEIMGSELASEIVTETGVPEEAYELECPDEQLRISVLEEFILLDKKYEAQLEYLDIKYQNVKQ